MPLLQGNRARRPGARAIYYEYFEFPGRARGAPPLRRAHRRGYKLIHYYGVGEWELFDLEKDPREMRSVYGDSEYKEILLELKGELWRLRQHYQDTDPDLAPKKKK